jgi:hypothetical protein
MLVFDITVPGTWLDHEGAVWEEPADKLLQLLEAQFFEANLALNFFNAAKSQLQRFPSEKRDALLRGIDRRREIREVVEQERAKRATREDWEEVGLEVEVRFKYEQWASGQPPKVFEDSISHLYARAFVYALDGFDRVLGSLAKTEGVPGEVAEIHKRIVSEFPHLRAVRNTAHHPEKRGLALDRKWNPIKLKPVDTAFAKLPGGAVFLDSLHGSRYGATTENGRIGQVDVSSESMKKLQDILNAVLHSFSWKGPKRHAPT